MPKLIIKEVASNITEEVLVTAEEYPSYVPPSGWDVIDVTWEPGEGGPDDQGIG